MIYIYKYLRGVTNQLRTGGHHIVAIFSMILQPSPSYLCGFQVKFRGIKISRKKGFKSFMFLCHSHVCFDRFVCFRTDHF